MGDVCGKVGDCEQKRRGMVFDLVSFHVMCVFLGFSFGVFVCFFFVSLFLVLVERIVV